VEGQAQVRRVHLVREAERIEIGGEVTARAVGRQQAQDASLFARMLVADGRGGNAIGALLLCGLNTRNGRGVGNIPRLAALEGLEVSVPLGGYRLRVGKPCVIQRFNVIGVAACELRGIEKLANQVCAHVTTGREGRPAANRLIKAVRWRKILLIIAWGCCDAATCLLCEVSPGALQEVRANAAVTRS
jgi:hypothetical protein